MDYRTALIARIKEEQQKRGLSLLNLAVMVHGPTAHASQALRVQRGETSIGMVQRYCDVLGIALAEREALRRRAEVAAQEPRINEARDLLKDGRIAEAIARIVQSSQRNDNESAFAYADRYLGHAVQLYEAVQRCNAGHDEFLDYLTTGMLTAKASGNAQLMSLAVNLHANGRMWPGSATCTMSYSARFLP